MSIRTSIKEYVYNPRGRKDLKEHIHIYKTQGKKSGRFIHLKLQDNKKRH